MEVEMEHGLVGMRSGRIQDVDARRTYRLPECLRHAPNRCRDLGQVVRTCLKDIRHVPLWDHEKVPIGEAALR